MAITRLNEIDYYLKSGNYHYAHIKNGVNSTILPFINIGEYALIVAGSFVIKNIPSKELLTGNSARVINDIDNLKYPDG